MSDFSLLDAIECGIVKLPRVPVADNVPSGEMPRYRELWRHIGASMPKKRKTKSAIVDPLKLPTDLMGAFQALYGHYVKTFEAMGGGGDRDATGVHSGVQQHDRVRNWSTSI